MEQGCCLNVVNCCSCNCMNSFTITVVELITSILGTGISSALFAIDKLIYEKSKLLSSLPIINITYFGSSSIIVSILIILKKLQKIEQLGFYKFSKIITLIYSYLSKLLAIFNFLIFMYLLSFGSFATFYISSDEAETLINEIKSVEYECQNDDNDCGITKEDSDMIEELTFFDFIYFCISVFVSIILTYYNGASFYSDNKRITHLIKGHLEIELIPTESNSICDKGVCEFLNSLICYKLTLLQILHYISFISVIYFIFSLILLIVGLTHPWPQALILGQSFMLPFEIVLSIISFISSLYCKFINICGNSEPPSKRKCIMLILSLLFILNFFIVLITYSSIIASQNGNSKVGISIDIRADDYYEKLYNSPFSYYYLDHMRDNYYIIFGIKSASIDKIFFAFILGAGILICNIILIFLDISYFRRALADFTIPLRNYTAKLFAIENGEKINLDLINVIPSTINHKKNINGEEVNEDIQIYTRKILTENVPITSCN